MEEHEKMLGVQKAKIINLGNNLVYRTQKLKITSAFALVKEKLQYSNKVRKTLERVKSLLIYDTCTSSYMYSLSLLGVDNPTK